LTGADLPAARSALQVKTWLAGVAGNRALLLAFGGGALSTLALPPLHLTFLLWLSFPLLLLQLAGASTARRAFLVGWCFGLGQFALGLYWIGFAFFVDAWRHGWLAVPAVLGLSAYLAIYPGLAAWSVRRLGFTGARLVVGFAAAWAVGEWLRGHLLTGFPWNPVGHALGFSPIYLQSASWFGIYGLTLVVVLIAGAPACLAAPGAWRDRFGLPLLALAVLAGLGIWGAWRMSGEMPPAGPMVRLVQPNIEQSLKWRDDQREANFARHLELSAAPGPKFAAILWPETALIYRLDRDPARRARAAAIVPEGGYLLTGALRVEAPNPNQFKIFNGLIGLDRAGQTVATYDKAHLVPFGEYLPLRWILGAIGFDKLTIGDIDFSAGPGARTIALAGLPAVSPLVCYEVIFPGAVADPAARPAWLLNVTNDGWYGKTAGPHQHFASARLRAIEEGVPMVRVANTGISGVVDSFGRIVATLGLARSGMLDLPLPPPLATATVYARFGDWGFLALVLLILLPLGRKSA
jgi:apolipoprotein N-acyltransferase